MTGDNEDAFLRSAAAPDAEAIRVARQTDAWRTEAILRAQADLLNLVHDGIFVCDMNGVVRSWNRAAEALYGWTAEQAIGEVVHALLKTAFPRSLEQIERDVMRSGRWEGELVQTRRDGSQIVVASRWSLQRDESGAPAAILASNEDVTDRKRAEHAREQIEEQWRAAFESNPAMYFILDAAGAFLSINAAAAEQLDYRVSELIGQPVSSVFYEPDRDFVRTQVDACFAQPGRKMSWEARKIRKDGTMLWVREKANAVVLQNRPVLLVVCEDITEQKRAEEAVSRGAKVLRDVIDTIPALVFSTGSAPGDAWVNQRWVEYSGLSVEETKGLGWQSTIHPDDLDVHVAKWHRSLAGGEPFENEARHRSAKGDYRWFLVRAVPLRDEQGRIVRWYGTLTDVEDRKRTDALLAGERRILEMVARGDTLSRILDSVCRVVEEHAPDVLASILLIEDGRVKHGGAPSLPKAYVDAIEGAAIGPSAGSCGAAAWHGKQVVVSDIANDPLWTDYRDLALPHSLRACWSTPIMSAEGKVIGTFAMYYREPRSPCPRDQEIIEQITHLAGIAIERKLTEEKLRRSEAYLGEAQKLTHTGSWAADPATRKLLYGSEELLRIFGFDPQQGLPTRDALMERIHPEDRQAVFARVQKAVREKSHYIGEFRVLLPDGAVKYVEGTGHPVFNTRGEITAFVGTTVDVTERKRAEQERERLRQLEAELAHMNRMTMMSALTASLAHELNQPIAAAITNANACVRWLTRPEPDLEEARAAAMRIAKDGSRAAEIIDRLRSFYKKGGPPRRELVHVNDIAGEMMALLRQEADRHAIAMRSNFAPEVPKVVADPVQLQQVLMNLMLNGIEAMHETGGELIIKSDVVEDGQLLISVSDTGVGLPAGKAEQVFNAFFTTKPQGTGMGLAISRSIIESHGGRLWTADNTGRGATFYFTLPRETAG
jgi:PAS domain S-box-containing protein